MHLTDSSTECVKCLKGVSVIWSFLCTTENLCQRLYINVKVSRCFVISNAQMDYKLCRENHGWARFCLPIQYNTIQWCRNYCAVLRNDVEIEIHSTQMRRHRSCTSHLMYSTMTSLKLLNSGWLCIINGLVYITTSATTQNP